MAATNESISCVCGKTVSKTYYNAHCRSQFHKTYMENNGLKDNENSVEYKTPIYIRKAAAQYYERNREKILARESSKVTCECGSTISINNVWGHKNTKKHINWSSNKQSK